MFLFLNLKDVVGNHETQDKI